MAIKAIYLDNRVLKTPTTGGELKNLQSTTNIKEYIESIIGAQPTEFFADGTAAAPSITFVGDTDTGLFLGGNNILGFSVNGTKVLDVRTAQVTVDGTTLLNGILRITQTPQTLTGAGAVNLTTYSTLLVTTGANALTLAAGSEGQFKFIKMKTDGGDGTLTVTNLEGGTTITFNDAGDFVHLFYQDAKWNILTNSGCTVA